MDRRVPDDAGLQPRGGHAPFRCAPGSSVTVNVSVTRVGGFTDPVTVELAGAPAGFSAAAVTTGDGFVSLQVTTTESVAPGVYYLPLQSSSGDIFHSGAVTVDVPALPHELPVGDEFGGGF